MSHKHFSHLIKWSNDQYSHLPWRRERTLYRTLVSEIMLQQTTVGTVLNHFENFLSEFPTIFDLAESSEEEVCISWKGLGYYRRDRDIAGGTTKRYDRLSPLGRQAHHVQLPNQGHDKRMWGCPEWDGQLQGVAFKAW